MKRPRLARLATDLLADEPIVPRAPSVDAEARSVEAIARAIRARARRQRRLRIMGGVAIAASLLLAVGYSVRTRAGQPASAPAAASSSQAPAEELVRAQVVDVGSSAVLIRRSTNHPLEPSTALEPGDRLVAAPAGLVAFKLADTSRVTVDADSEVTVASLASTRRFHLSRGALRADVTKLAPGERFVVETADAEVEVHGTSFRVALVPEGEIPAGCTQARTRVTVFEGVVAVRWRGAEERVTAGTAWPPPCAVPPSAQTTSIARSEAPGPSAASVQRAGTPAPGPGPSHAPTSVATAPPVPRPMPETSHALAEQNQLFAEATAARRNGNAAAAVAAYERLLARHPGSVLAESATVERMRTLDTIDRARARAAAADYLARYPKGYARAEAERLMGR